MSLGVGFRPSAFTRVPACLLANLTKAVFYTELLRRIRYLLHRSDYYWLEATLVGREIAPADNHRLS